MSAYITINRSYSDVVRKMKLDIDKAYRLRVQLKKMRPTVCNTIEGLRAVNDLVIELMKNALSDDENEANQICKKIYEENDESEICSTNSAIKSAWELGRKLSDRS